MGFHFDQAKTFAHGQEDFSYWHQGRSHYAVWAIKMADRAIAQRVDDARRHLTDVLLPGYVRQLHVTLTVCGFPNVIRQYADDFLPVDLAKQEQVLNVAKVRPFVIEIDSLDSFAGAPFLRVIDCDQGIARLRACLDASLFEQFGFCYTPHLTIGLYGRSIAEKTLLALLRGFKTTAPLRFEVNAIHWVRYEARDIGGPLESLAEYSLEENCLFWKVDAPFGVDQNNGS